MEREPIPIIGIVGGVGSGKSAVARWLTERYGGLLIDADVVGHEVLLHEGVKQELRGVFGEAIFEKGEIARRRLAELVFGDQPAQATARATLEKIVHPAMNRIIKSRIASAQRSADIPLIVLDAAILLESGWRENCNVVAFVDVPRDLRLQRVASSRGWSDEELSRREASQWPLPQKRQAADIVVDNSASVEDAGLQLVDFLVNQGWLATVQQESSGISEATATTANSP